MLQSRSLDICGLGSQEGQQHDAWFPAKELGGGGGGGGGGGEEGFSNSDSKAAAYKSIV